MTHPDVVYVVRPGERNEELRYSLRSLRNLPHGKVWIAGYCPLWVADEVGRIPVERHRDRNVSAKANLRAACEHPEVSEEFVYFNDDFFVMQPLESLPVMHRGPLAEAVRSGIMATAYTASMRQTLAILTKHGIDEPLMYDLHAPMTVTKTGMLAALDLCIKPTLQERTLFGNLQQVGGLKCRNHKVGRTQRGWQSWPFLSTKENTFRTLPVGEHIRGQFETPSPYEKDPTPIVVRGYPHRSGTPFGVGTPPPARRPVRYTAGTTIRRVRRAGVPA